MTIHKLSNGYISLKEYKYIMIKIIVCTLGLLVCMGFFSPSYSRELKVQNVVHALIHVESRGRARVVSPEGAIGLMQIMPSTAYRKYHIKRKQLFNPKINVMIGTRYLNELTRNYNGNIYRALIAYKCGPNMVLPSCRKYAKHIMYLARKDK